MQSSPSSTDKDKRRELNSSGIINSSPKSPAKPVGTNSSESSSANGSEGTLEFSKNKIIFNLYILFLFIEMSAAEYREKLKAQHAGKRDPRQGQHMSMKEKHDYIDRL
jgi:hypothetical protein